MSRAVVVWLNGPFGVGKTTVAKALAAEMIDALIFDPELVGFMLRKIVPRELRSSTDFQDLPLWRRLTRTIIQGLLSEYDRPVIVPMTLVNPVYFDEIVGELRRSGIDVHHVALMAGPATIRRRLMRRLSHPTSTLWGIRQIDRCLAALQSPEFAVQLPTDRMAVADIVTTIRRQLTP
jgi:cytidylate kinase